MALGKINEFVAEFDVPVQDIRPRCRPWRSLKSGTGFRVSYVVGGVFGVIVATVLAVAAKRICTAPVSPWLDSVPPTLGKEPRACSRSSSISSSAAIIRSVIARPSHLRLRTISCRISRWAVSRTSRRRFQAMCRLLHLGRVRSEAHAVCVVGIAKRSPWTETQRMESS